MPWARPGTRLARLAALLPTLVNVMVEVRAGPPGTWSSVPVRTLIEHVELVLAALTDPPEPVPVEKHVLVPLPSSS